MPGKIPGTASTAYRSPSATTDYQEWLTGSLQLRGRLKMVAWNRRIGLVERSCPRRGEDTFRVKKTACHPKITVSADGRGVVSQAGALLLLEAAGLARWCSAGGA